MHTANIGVGTNIALDATQVHDPVSSYEGKHVFFGLRSDENWTLIMEGNLLLGIFGLVKEDDYLFGWQVKRNPSALGNLSDCRQKGLNASEQQLHYSDKSFRLENEKKDSEFLMTPRISSYL